MPYNPNKRKGLARREVRAPFKHPRRETGAISKNTGVKAQAAVQKAKSSSDGDVSSLTTEWPSEGEWPPKEWDPSDDLDIDDQYTPKEWDPSDDLDIDDQYFPQIDE